MTHRVPMNDGYPTNIVCETDNGCITRCICCEAVYLEFGNIVLKLDLQRFNAFKSFMYNLDYEKMETANAFLNLRRRIVIRVDKTNVTIVLNRDECFEIVDLLRLAELYLDSDPWWSELGNSDFTQN